jgi:aminopeptidase N
MTGCTADPPDVHAATLTAAPRPKPAPVNAYPAGRSEPVADPVYPAYGNPSIDVLHYGLTLNWEPSAKTLTGVAELTVRAVRPVTELSLDFAHTLTTDVATVGGLPVTAVRKGDKLLLQLAKPLAADAAVVATIVYHGTPQQVPFPSHRGDAGEGLGLRPAADGSAWTMQEPYGAFTWYPCSDQPSDEATYDIDLTAPPGWTGVAGGTFTGARGTTTHFTSAAPVATYLTTVAFGKYTHTTAKGPHGIPLDYWTRTGTDQAMLAAFQQTPKRLEWLETQFGPYPFTGAGALVVDSVSAMETQEMLTIGGQAMGKLTGQEAADATDQMLVHELAHQWFGDSVGPRDWRGIWLNEGWAMYTEGMYMIDTGKADHASWVAWARKVDAKYRASAGPPGNYHKDDFAASNVYFGPALMLNEIRETIGDQAFFALARDWVQTQRDSHQDRASFTAFVNKHTGRDLTAIVNKWLDSPTTPR